MNHPTISIQIEDRVYHLDISDAQALRDIPSQDKQELLMLLKGIEKQEMLSKGEPVSDQPFRDEPAQSKLTKEGMQHANSALVASSLTEQRSQEVIRPSIPQEKPISRDADQLMARLIADEKKHQKSFSKRQLYMIFSVVSLFILLLMLLFV